MNQLSDLPNIGTELQKQLMQVEIKSFEQLRRIGAEKAWLKIQAIDGSACLHRLYALEGAIQGIKKSELSDERKQELREFFHWNK